MMVHQGFNSFSKCSSRLFSEELKHSHLASGVQFFLPYLLRWCYVIVDNFPSCFMIHRFSRVTYLNPSFSLRSRHLFNQLTSSLDLSWVIFHLKLSLRILLIMVLINDPSLHLSSRRNQFLVSLFISIQSIVLVSGRISPHNFGMFSISPLQAYSFCCWFSNNSIRPFS